jgi:hypothetical protein
LLAPPKGLLASTLPRSTAKIAIEASPDAHADDPSPETLELEHFGPNILRRRWRNVMGRHPPKMLSQALMARILMWREQVAEVGDISTRARAILVEALGRKDDRVDAHGFFQEGAAAPDVRLIRRNSRRRRSARAPAANPRALGS